MRISKTLGFVALTALVAVGCDTDDDGLSNQEEKALGSDPENPDTDGDGLTDGEEVEMGLDPTSIDSDEDGYRDQDEIAEGSDPADGDDWIYEGHWPYNADKDGFDAPDFDGRADEGDQVPAFKAVDQFGDEVDIYDFAGEGQPPLVFDISAVWCGPCNEMADWMSGENVGWLQSADDVRLAVEAGTVRWVTFLFQNANGGPADEDDSENWDEDYPNEMVPVMTDSDADMADWIAPPGIPSLTFVDAETMEIEIHDDTNAVFNEILENYIPED